MGKGPIREFIILMANEGEKSRDQAAKATPNEMPVIKLSDAIPSKSGTTEKPHTSPSRHYITEYS